MAVNFIDAAHGWITVIVPEEWERWARTLRADRDKRYENIYDVEPTDARWVGDLGEKVFDAWLRHRGSANHKWILDAPAGQEDFVLPGGARIGVKTVKRKDPPRPSYSAQVTARHVHEPVEDYFFLTYELDVQRMWLLGGIDKTTFLAKAKYYAEGEKVHAHYTVRQGHEIYNVDIENLTGPTAWYARYFGK